MPQFSGHDPVLPERGQGDPPAIAPNTVRGEGSAADGMIQVTVTYEGRIDQVRLDPEVLRLGPRRDAEVFAREIKEAVNAAIDHLHEILREDIGGFGGTDVDLNEVAERFEGTMSRLSQDIAEAHRRLES
ncbi:MAG: YbaB/EbfC family nucleoid-associated protein [Actinomadura sp.]